MIFYFDVINMWVSELVDFAIFVSLSDIIDWVYLIFGVC